MSRTLRESDAATPAYDCVDVFSAESSSPYLYSLLETEALGAVSRMGLDAGLGVLHADTPHRDSLALDVLEPARPQLDSYVIDTFLRQPLRKEWFFEERNGNARLMASLTAQLSETATMWARAVAPIAEWVAQSVWIQRKKPSSEQLLPTRLTQRRRTEGRGHTFKPVKAVRMRRPKICELCGAEGIKNRYCRSCGVEVARENMTRAALIGHARPKTARTRTEISKKLSEHAGANTWWDPKTLPSWLTEKCYREQIQPRLRDKRIREIAEAMQVSEPYAAFVRSGRRRPHPRHWEVLAQLVCVFPDVGTYASP